MAEVVGSVPDRIVTLREISQRTTVPVPTLQWWRAREPERGPRMFKIGGRVVAKSSDVEAWIEQQYAAGQVSA